MHDNTPPRPVDIDSDGEDLEEVYVDNENPPDDDDLEMEEVTLEELEARFGADAGDSDEEADRRSPVQDDSIYTFQQHKAPVFSCAFHPQNNLCATGGEDDKVFIWNRTNGEVIYEIAQHKDTVTDVHFNHDGNYLATGDMAGEIFLHKIQQDSSTSADGSKEAAGDIVVRKVWEYSMGDMTWMRWHRVTNVLMAGSEDGEIYVFRLPAGDCKILPGNGARCESGELSGDGKKLFACYNNGTVKLWDIKTCAVVMEIDEQNTMVHSEGSGTVACDKESPLYASGGEDGKIIFSTPNGPVGMVMANGAVECLAFSSAQELRMVASGTLSGQVAVWDPSKLNMRIQCQHPEDGITKIVWLSEFTILVSTLQGSLYAYDARTGQRKFSLTGHLADIYSFDYDARESLLLTASEDNSAKIFKVPQLGD